MDEETPFSMQVNWEVLDSDVEQYKVTYVSADRTEETVSKHNHSTQTSITNVNITTQELARFLSSSSSCLLEQFSCTLLSESEYIKRATYTCLICVPARLLFHKATYIALVL